MRSKQEVAASFDGKAGDYRLRRESSYGFRTQRRLVLSMIGGRGGRALEVGCGSGGIAADLVERGFNVVAIDLSLEMLRAARGRLAQDGVRFLRADAERLCFRAAGFDLVVAMGVLEYLPDPGEAIAEIRRVLRDGGEAIVTVPTSISPSALMDRLFESFPASLRRMLLWRDTLPKGDPVHRLAPWELDRALARAGLEPRERGFCQFTMFPVDAVLPALSERIGRLLEPLGRNRFTGPLARQYLVRAVAR